MWRFDDTQGTTLSLETNSLSIVSTKHTTYNTPGTHPFRETIEFAVGAFLEVAQLQSFLRIGLRYVNECPVPQKDNATISKYYATALPLARFDISQASKMEFETVGEASGSRFRYAERLQALKTERPHYYSTWTPSAKRRQRPTI
ncbi:MAG: TIGR04255 family protein [Planctomycetes bacterium]|nr:TIGR04255 family protein [Planctomycetota bacterium]